MIRQKRKFAWDLITFYFGFCSLNIERMFLLNGFIWFLSSVLLLFGPPLAATVLEKTVEVRTETSNPVAARKELLDLASEKVTEDLLKEIIGEAKMQRNKAIIRSKVYKNSGRFIPWSKASDLKANDVKSGGKGFSMTVQLRIERESLEAVLLENGLFYESDGPPSILAMVHVADRIQMRSFSWWQGLDKRKTEPFLLKLNQSFENQLKQNLAKQNFYLLPALQQKYEETLTPSDRGETLRADQMQSLAEKFGAKIFLYGLISIGKGSRSDNFTIQAKVTAAQSNNSRVITEVLRQVETDRGNMEVVVERKSKDLFDTLASDLASQVVGAWQKGALGTEVYRLTLKGGWKPQDLDKIKLEITSAIRDIKNLRERTLEEKKLVFEYDSAVGPEVLRGKFSSVQWLGKQYVAEKDATNELVYTARE